MSAFLRTSCALLVALAGCCAGAARGQADDAPSGGPAPDAATPLAADAELSVDAPDTELLLGQRFEVALSGALDGVTELLVGPVPEGLRAGTPRLETGERGPRFVVPLRAVREGTWELDGMSLVRGEERIPLPPTRVSVVLPLPAGAVPRVADPRPPVELPLPAEALWPFFAGILGGLLLVGLWIVRAGRVVAVPLAPPRAPGLVAIEALAQLRAHLPQTADEVPAFVVRTSSVLRTYVEERFGLAAPDQTTEEFLQELAGRSDALGRHRDELARFCRACDLVKFAAHRPAPRFVVELLDVAAGFVEATHAVPGDALPAPSEAGAGRAA